LVSTEIIGWPAAIAAATLALMCSNWALRSGGLRLRRRKQKPRRAVKLSEIAHQAQAQQ
jgi:hypothetical protein